VLLRSLRMARLACLTLDEQRPSECQPPWSLYLNVVAPVCLCVGAALLHVNLSAYHSYRCRILYTADIVGDPPVYYVGWPVTYAASLSESPLLRPPMVFALGWLAVDLFAAAAIVACTAIVVSSWCVRRVRESRYSPALFSMEIPVLLSILVFDRMYGWVALADASRREVYSGVYTDLPDYPWYDQLGIVIGIVCTVHLAFTALWRVFRSCGG
jgi:hypothetical protein